MTNQRVASWKSGRELGSLCEVTDLGTHPINNFNVCGTLNHAN